MVTPLNGDWANWQNMLLDSVCKNIFLCFVTDSPSLQECSLFRNSYGSSRTCPTHPHRWKHKLWWGKCHHPSFLAALTIPAEGHIPSACSRPQTPNVAPAATPYAQFSYLQSAVSDIVLAGGWDVFSQLTVQLCRSLVVASQNFLAF